MKTETVTKIVYVADDGSQFDDEKTCQEYEKRMGNIKHYRIMHSPDLNETGNFCRKTYVAILYDKCPSMAPDILLEYIYREFKCILGPSVMGFGMQRHVIFDECSKDEYMRHPAMTWGARHESPQLFLSDINVSGYPKHINFLKEWKLDK